MVNDVIEIDKIIGMPVMSRTTGEKLGAVHDLYVDPAQGVLMGVTIKAPNGKFGGIDFHNVYSFGRDAVMANDESQITLIDEKWIETHPHARKHLVGTNVLTESGDQLGQIGNVYVRLTSPPMVIYELRGSMWDSLLGRNFFIYAAAAGAISSNAERIIIPNAAVNGAASSLSELASRPAQPGGRTVRRTA